jgi:2-iminobutanoate/2-iminopropanoate deaminase
MKKKILMSGKISVVGPYSAAVEADGLIFISGQLPVNPQTGEIIMDIREATHQVLTNLQTLLEENGLSLKNIIKTTLFLKHISDFAAVNEIYAGFFPAAPPARSTVEVSALPKGAPLEIEAVAIRK